MKKIAFFLFFMCIGYTVGHAQITTGESYSGVVRTGNRAQSGDFGIYLGGTSTIIKNLGNLDNFDFLPLINLKYMYSDEVEYRLGLEWWKETAYKENDYSEQSDFESRMMLYPGVAYHFSKSNLLDVYAGAELPFGWGSEGFEEDYDGNGSDGKATQFNIGIGAFIGLQAYVGNLPLAVGLEYGISTLYGAAKEGYISDDGMSVSYYEDAKSNVWKLGNQARFTLTYFFEL